MSSPTDATTRIALLTLLCWLLSACAAAPSVDAPSEYLDQETAATVSVVGRPMTFAHERPERAAHMRDYVTLAAAAINRGGKTDYVLITYFWTTFDAHGQEGESHRQSPSSPAPDPLVIAADDRRIAVRMREANAHDAGIGIPVDAPPAHPATPYVYKTDLPTLRFMAAARHLTVLPDAQDPALVFEIWDDRRAALQNLVQLLNGE